MTTEIANTQADLPLPVLIDRAASALSKARTAGEVLEARDLADVAYTAAKLAARLAKAKKAHDDLIAAAFRAQADALEIEALAKRRLADEYDAAQARGEVQTAGGDRTSKVSKQNNAATAADIGLSRKEIHEARAIRDAEKRSPGIVRRTVDRELNAGREPTKAAVRKATSKYVPKLSPKPIQKNARSIPLNRQVNQLTADLADACDRMERFIDVRGQALDADGYYSIFQHIELAVKQLQTLAYDRIAQHLDG